MASPANPNTELSNDDVGHRRMPDASPQRGTEVLPTFVIPSESDILLYELGESLQQRRLNLSDYTPISLPASRVPTLESSLQPPPSSIPDPTPSAPLQTLQPNPDTSTTSRKIMNSPPLTPASTHDPTQFRHSNSAELQVPGVRVTSTSPGDPVTMTPQTSPPRSAVLAARSHAEDGSNHRPHSSGSFRQAESQGSHYMFTIGPPDDSDYSHENSFSATSTESESRVPPSRPFTPAGEQDNPYARSKRPPQKKGIEDIEPRFIFGGKGSRPHGSSSSLSAAGAGGELRSDKKHHSHFSLHSLGKGHDDSPPGSRHGSMVELKRFFKSSQKRAKSPGASSVRSSKSSKSQVSLPSPFADDHGLSKKYGRFGKVLGSGAGGSVRLMKRSSDGVTFAVKEFRPRHAYETEREYAKKVTAEFCIGSTLHNGNIVETLDIVHERGKWYEVMEYCPYDLFATVMTGKMSREETACCFMQILSGLTYLHRMGLAHRDMKLDNVVMNEHGILKIIDFGSASVFRYPFENDIVEAHGIVGSDPYLAPEVCNDLKYDPQPADIWSIAIIYCCMTLRRFPWKAPRQSDNSFKLFSMQPDPPTNSNTPAPLPTSRSHQNNRPSSGAAGRVVSKESSTDKHYIEGNASNPAPSTVQGSGQQQQLKGPFRLLRLLPRESRHIISRMLELNPKKRATLEEVWNDEWVKSISHCQQEEGGKIVKGDGHTHVLEGQSGGSNPSNRKSTK